MMMAATKEIQVLLLSISCLYVSAQDTLSTGGDLSSICQTCRTKVCILSIPNDCGAYVVCESGHAPSQLRCPFGTFFNEKDIRCDFPSIIKCAKDPCSDPRYPNLVSYRDFRMKEPNCRYYWKCNGKYSAAECCAEGTAYSATDGACVKDPKCNASCPRNPYPNTTQESGTAVTVCSGEPKTLTCPLRMEVQINDVFYGRRDTTTCGPATAVTQTCSSRTALHTVQSQCVGKQSCTITADPSLYRDPCPGVNKYLEIDYLCKPGCNLKSIDSTTFYNEARASEKQKCGHGTRFDSELCTCVSSGRTAPLCRLEVHITFNGVKTKVVQNEAESPVWIFAKDVEKMKGYGQFLGNGSITIPFYSGNDNLARKFGIQIRVFAIATGPTKQVLLTNCDRDTSVHPDAASLEIYINRTTSGSFIHIRIINVHNTITSLQLPIKLREWTNVLYRFDGSYLHGTLQHINKDTADVQEDKGKVEFTGNMMTSSGPLRIGSCTDYVDGLFAYIDEIQISFCKVSLPIAAATSP